MHARTIPILPATDLRETARFYAPLGFAAQFHAAEGYLLLKHREQGGVELHFTNAPETDAWMNDRMAYLRVPNIAEWHEGAQVLGLTDDGIPRLSRIERKDWGMLECDLVDPNGNRLRVGQQFPSHN